MASTHQRVAVRDDLADVEPYGAPQLDVAVRLNTNETPWPPPAAFFEQLATRLRTLEVHRYPDRRAWALRRALGERFGLPPEQVWAASGSNEVLQHLLQAYGGPGRRLLVFRPGYSMYPRLATVAATEVVEADLDERLQLTADLAAQAVERYDPDLIFLANPNNPTGLSVPIEAVRRLHDRSRALVVLDEAYVEFGETFGEHSGARLLDELPRLAVTRTFSKAWRLAGARLGFLLAAAWVVDDLRKVRLPYHLDAFVQEAGLVALDMAEDMTAHVDELGKQAQWLHDELEHIPGVQVWPTAANFLLLRTDVADLFDRLLARGVLVRDFSSHPRLEGCLRVTVGTPEENQRFLSALKESLP